MLFFSLLLLYSHYYFPFIPTIFSVFSRLALPQPRLGRASHSIGEHTHGGGARRHRSLLPKQPLVEVCQGEAHFRVRGVRAAADDSHRPSGMCHFAPWRRWPTCQRPASALVTAASQHYKALMLTLHPDKLHRRATKEAKIGRAHV